MTVALNYYFDNSMGYDGALSLRDLPRPIPSQGTAQGSTFAIAGSPTVTFAEDRPRVIVIRIDRPAVPRWLHSASARFQELMQLGQNWDTYGANPIRADAAIAGIQLLSQVMGESVPEPSFVPVPSGGVQLEWHGVGRDVEVEVESFARARLFFVGQNNEQEIHSEGTVPEIATQLRALLGNPSG